MATVFFDILQAFDKIWHNGLLKKLFDYKIPLYYIKWIDEFLKDRIFCVKVGDYTSNWGNIKVGVPQGAVLSPILFGIYINDISTLNIKKHSYSLLFADDLVKFFIYKNNKNIEREINNYTSLIQRWLSKWRFTMQPQKCNLLVFNKSGHKSHQEHLNIKLSNLKIPSVNHVKFLGLTLDIMNFIEHAKIMKRKCSVTDLML